MKEYGEGVLLKAFDEFFEEDRKLADAAGYDVVTADDENGKSLYVDISTEYDDLPQIDVHVKEQNDGTFIFEVDVDFPEFSFKDNSEKLVEYVDSWKDVAKFVDDLLSVKFDPEEWIEK